MGESTSAELRDWPRTEAEAVAAQERLREAADLVGPGPGPEQVRTVAGVDVAYADDGGLVAAAVVLDAATLTVLDEAVHVGRTDFPYVPGLLAFRELPSVMAALRGLSRHPRPDVVVCDGYGVAHPRRAGLAVHLGVLTGLPCFGVAKTPFLFEYTQPGPERGAWTPLTIDGEQVGRALRTRAGVKPVFVSVGSGIGLDNACALTLRLARTYRQPETTRRADRLARRGLAEHRGGSGGREDSGEGKVTPVS
ncbi:endonuclease V [Streptomyces sp. 891-h]|uniref:endonuclease V n=1 Tax=unclassified Streptomyces TaxID=2593676 RepID=UPI001FAA91EE|nr:endonuclease V [Streptomyces sp. 891-h]UNZ16594.1 endonuclease V [Streptomyces sp. 891-h]